MKPQPTLAVVSWLLLLAAIVFAPESMGDIGELRTKDTVRLALAYYGVAAWMMIALSPESWAARTRPGQFARLCWSLGWLAYVVHLGFAFHYYHYWSHADAVERTQRVSGFGPGIYFSHLFTLAWTGDVSWWWLRPDSYAHRPKWVGFCLHAFMLFLIFNATLVFAEGIIMPLGALLVLTLAGRFAYCRLYSSRSA